MVIIQRRAPTQSHAMISFNRMTFRCLKTPGLNAYCKRFAVRLFNSNGKHNIEKSKEQKRLARVAAVTQL